MLYENKILWGKNKIYLHPMETKLYHCPWIVINNLILVDSLHEQNYVQESRDKLQAWSSVLPVKVRHNKKKHWIVVENKDGDHPK